MWPDVCKPKKGGLRLRLLEEVNRVSCMKLIWRILSSRSSMWVQWIHKYLIRKGSFWSVKESSSLGSWMWKKLLKLRPLAMPLTRVEVCNSSTTSFWYDKWSQLGVLINLTGERGCIDLGVSIHAMVERAVQSYRRRRHITNVLLQIEQEILRLRALGLSQQDDMALWKRENDVFQQGFESSQTWNLIRAQSPHVPWFKGISFKEATLKFSFLTWLAVHNRLSTGDRILKWNPQAFSICWLCKTATETRDHLFFDFSFSKEVWIVTIRGLAGVGVPAQWSVLLQRLVTGLQDSTKTSSSATDSPCYLA